MWLTNSDKVTQSRVALYHTWVEGSLAGCSCIIITAANRAAFIKNGLVTLRRRRRRARLYIMKALRTSKRHRLARGTETRIILATGYLAVLNYCFVLSALARLTTTSTSNYSQILPRRPPQTTTQNRAGNSSEKLIDKRFPHTCLACYRCCKPEILHANLHMLIWSKQFII